MQIKKRVFIIEGLAFMLIGAVFLFNSLSGITGAVILENVKVSMSALLGLVFVGVGVVVMMGGSLEERTTIGNVIYENHALGRMKKRKLFPSVIKDAIEHGEVYNLKNNSKGEEKGAYYIHVREKSADIAPGKGRIGERILQVNPGKRRYNHVVVLTDKKGIVKTAYVLETDRLRKYLRTKARD